MQIKFFQETWFIRVKESPIGHVFLLGYFIRREKGDKAQS